MTRSPLKSLSAPATTRISEDLPEPAARALRFSLAVARAATQHRTVDADDADFGGLEEGEVRALEQHAPAAHRLCHLRAAHAAGPRRRGACTHIL